MCISPLANTVMVASHEPHAHTRTVGPKTFCHKFNLATSSTRSSSFSPQTKNSYMSVVREHYRSQGLTEDTVDLLMNSWRSGTKEQYDIYLREWCSHFRKKGEPFQPTLHKGIEFLTHLSDNGYTYHQIAMARSASSSVIVMENHCGVTFGKHP